MNALKKNSIKPVYAPRHDMPYRTRVAFGCGMNTASIASLFGQKESAVERWLHLTSPGKYLPPDPKLLLETVMNIVKGY